MTRVAVKFCGGCDPIYDRSEYWRWIKDSSEGRIEWCTLEDDGIEAVLVISGCPKACPVEELYLNDSLPVLSLADGEMEPVRVVETLNSLGERHDQDEK
jgi:hypothetical protein